MTELEQVKAERDALAAQVEALRVAALNAISFMSGGEAKAQLRDAYDATPQQHLAELRAEAVLRFAGHVLAQYRYDVTNWASQYADSIRKGGAE